MRVICGICSNSEDNRRFRVREMMFGSREEFDYFECKECGCLQIAKLVRNPAQCYPPSYYSFRKEGSNSLIKRILTRKRNEYAFFKKSVIGKVLHMKYPNLLLDIISRTQANHASTVLDVGCGAGHLLYSLSEIGFSNLTGVDPYIDGNVMNGNVRILKNTIHDLSDGQKFDLAIFNHSLEHLPDQLETLSKVSKILTDNGVCLIKIPVKTEYIWNHYGTNWVQIDAPRHFFLHTPKSLELVVKRSGLVIRDVIFDSTEFQFWGSEQYKKNIPLLSENSRRLRPRKGTFTNKQIEEFKTMAKELNMNKQGDQAAFYLTKRWKE